MLSEEEKEESSSSSSQRVVRKRPRLQDPHAHAQTLEAQLVVQADLADTDSSDDDDDDDAVLSRHKHEYLALLDFYYEELIPPRLQLSHWKTMHPILCQCVAQVLANQWNRQQQSNNNGWTASLAGLYQHDTLEYALPILHCFGGTKRTSTGATSNDATNNNNNNNAQPPPPPLEFILIPGGSYTMGMTDALEERLYQLIVETYDLQTDQTYDDLVQTDDGKVLQYVTNNTRPTQEIAIAPFWLATTPLTRLQMQYYWDPDYQIDEFSPPEQGARIRHCYIQEPILQTYPGLFRLPSESEWEYAARNGGSDTLCPYDDSRLPSKEDLVVEGRYPMLTADALADITNHHHHDLLLTPWGLQGVACLPELCADLYHDSLDGIPPNGMPRSRKTNNHYPVAPNDDDERTAVQWQVIRGGGDIGGWQGCGEWGLLLPYSRDKYIHYPYDGGVGIRLAMDMILPLPEKEES